MLSLSLSLSLCFVSFFCCSSGTGWCVPFDCFPESDKLYCIFTGVVGVSEQCCDVLVLENTPNCFCFRRVLFVFFWPFSFTFLRSLVVLSFPKFWVGFMGFSFGPNFIGNFLFDSGRGFVAGPAWKLSTENQAPFPPHHGNEEEADGSSPLAVRSTTGPHR